MLKLKCYRFCICKQTKKTVLKKSYIGGGFIPCNSFTIEEEFHDKYSGILSVTSEHPRILN